ncbi:MAG TPA: alkylmercury lyase [Nitrospirae bacterium]|mgnify:CR=1 FL=1|nr:alkylmercury lyase [Nitrospirota bacterium]
MITRRELVRNENLMQQTQIVLLNQLADMIAGLLPALSDNERRVSLKLYRLLAHGSPVAAEQIAQTLNIPLAIVKNILDGWPGVYYNNEGLITGYWGLSISKAGHRFEVDGVELSTWCAWDTLFIPAIIGKTAHVETTCPVTKETISLTVWPDGIRSVAPPDIHVSFVTPDAGKFNEDIINNFCHLVYFFSSKEAASQWASEHEGTFTLTLDEAFELGGRKNEMQYKNILGA